MGHHYEQLREWERDEIYRLLSAGVSQAEIGRRLSRDRSTIGREIGRNRSVRGTYQPVAAERSAQRRRHARRTSKIKRLSRLEERIRKGLAMGHSPEQIAGRLRRDDHSLSISHESIYRFIHSPKGRKEQLHNYLAQAKSRRGRRARLGQRKPLIPNRISIHDRPPSIKLDLRFGHWEGDLMSFGQGDGNALVLTEQKSRFILAARQTGKKSLATAVTIKRLLERTPKWPRPRSHSTMGASSPDTNRCGSTPIFATLIARGRKVPSKTPSDGYAAIFLARPSRAPTPATASTASSRSTITHPGSASLSKLPPKPSAPK